jgi:hypothetical protein
VTYVVTENCIKCKHTDTAWKFVPSTASTTAKICSSSIFFRSRHKDRLRCVVWYVSGNGNRNRNDGADVSIATDATTTHWWTTLRTNAPRQRSPDVFCGSGKHSTTLEPLIVGVAELRDHHFTKENEYALPSLSLLNIPLDTFPDSPWKQWRRLSWQVKMRRI